jgi:hypothetical protein
VILPGSPTNQTQVESGGNPGGVGNAKAAEANQVSASRRASLFSEGSSNELNRPAGRNAGSRLPDAGVK